MLIEREAYCHFANAFLSRLELIWPISSRKIPKCPKNAFLTKTSGSQWVNNSTVWPSRALDLKHSVFSRTRDTVEPPFENTSRKPPPLLSIQFSKIPKVSNSNCYIWNLL